MAVRCDGCGVRTALEGMVGLLVTSSRARKQATVCSICAQRLSELTSVDGSVHSELWERIHPALVFEGLPDL